MSRVDKERIEDERDQELDFASTKSCDGQAQYEPNKLRGSEWLKFLENHSASNPASRESTQISTTSESPPESIEGNVDEMIDGEKSKFEIWDSAKKRKTRKGGLAEKWEDMIKNEYSDRALKEHFKGKESIMGISFSSDLAPLTAKILNFEIGLDNLIRFRCVRDTIAPNDCSNRIFASVSNIFEVVLNKDELNCENFASTVKTIELHKPFVEVDLNDYYQGRETKPLTVITNPSKLKLV